MLGVIPAMKRSNVAKEPGVGPDWIAFSVGIIGSVIPAKALIQT